MAIRQILEFPDPRLRTQAAPVVEFDAALAQLVDDMFETMYAAPGIGLAATQINVHKRIVVMDLSEEKDAPQVFINPEIEVIDAETASYDEGCLSVPGFFESVSRPSRVSVKARDRDGGQLSIEAGGLLAVCLQHEIDHLEGRLFVDYLSTVKRQRIRTKLLKQHKDRASVSQT